MKCHKLLSKIQYRKCVYPYLLHNNYYYIIIRKWNDRSRFTVSGVIEWFHGKKDLTNNTWNGYPQDLTGRDKKIVNIMNKEPKITSSEMDEIVRNKSNSEINSITVRRILKTTAIKHLTIERRKEQWWR